MNANPLTVLIVDDHPVVREGLSAMLSTDPGIQLVGEAGTGAEALSMIAALRPSVVVVDLLLPDIGGAEIIRRVTANSSDIAFVVLTSVAGDEEIYRALEAGARGYLFKDMARKELIQAVRTVTPEGATFPRKSAPRSPRTFRAPISARAKLKSFS